MSKTQNAIQPGMYIPQRGETCFRTLDGSDVAKWLESLGYEIERFYDTGRNGLAITKCGLAVSTNGYVSKWPHE